MLPHLVRLSNILDFGNSLDLILAVCLLLLDYTLCFSLNIFKYQGFIRVSHWDWNLVSPLVQTHGWITWSCRSDHRAMTPLIKLQKYNNKLITVPINSQIKSNSDFAATMVEMFNFFTTWTFAECVRNHVFFMPNMCSDSLPLSFLFEAQFWTLLAEWHSWLNKPGLICVWLQQTFESFVALGLQRVKSTGLLWFHSR